MEPTREELIQIVAFTVASNRRTLKPKASELEIRILAGEIVDHLVQCRVRFEKLAPEEFHKTP